MAGASQSRRSAKSVSWIFVVGWVSIGSFFPQIILSAVAPAAIRMGYPQPSGAMLPLWVITEARLDHMVSICKIFTSPAAPG